MIELKASEDVHLPLQALDYWMRVKWHLDRGEFTRRGYFPGSELPNQPPRLLLVSPGAGFSSLPMRRVLRCFFAARSGGEGRRGLSNGVRS